MSMSKEAKQALFESAILLEEARSLLMEGYSNEDTAPAVTSRAVAGIVDALAILQDRIYSGGGVKVIGLNFPTRMGAIFERRRDG